MEIKTCEQYVLNLLEENQNEIARLQEVIRNLNRKIGEENERYDNLKKEALEVFHVIRSIATVHPSENNEWSISFDTIYENSEGSAFEMIARILTEE